MQASPCSGEESSDDDSTFKPSGTVSIGDVTTTSEEEFDEYEDSMSVGDSVVTPPPKKGRRKKVSAEDLGIDTEASRGRYNSLIQSTIDKLDGITPEKKSNSILVTRKKYKFIQNLFLKTLEYEVMSEEHRLLTSKPKFESREDEEKARLLHSTIKNFRITDTFDKNKEKKVKEIWVSRMNWLQLFRVVGSDNHIQKFKTIPGKKAVKERNFLSEYKFKDSDFQGRVYQVEESFDVLLGEFLQHSGKMKKNAFAKHVSHKYCSFTGEIAKMFYSILGVNETEIEGDDEESSSSQDVEILFEQKFDSVYRKGDMPLYDDEGLLVDTISQEIQNEEKVSENANTSPYVDGSNGMDTISEVVQNEENVSENANTSPYVAGNKGMDTFSHEIQNEEKVSENANTSPYVAGNNGNVDNNEANENIEDKDDGLNDSEERSEVIPDESEKSVSEDSDNTGGDDDGEESSNASIVSRGGGIHNQNLNRYLSKMNFSINDPKLGVVYGGECIMCGTRLSYVAYTHVKSQYILLDWIDSIEDMEDIVTKLTTMLSFHGLLPTQIVLDCDGLTFNRNRYRSGEYVGRNLFEGDDDFFIDTRRNKTKSKFFEDVFLPVSQRLQGLTLENVFQQIHFSLAMEETLSPLKIRIEQVLKMVETFYTDQESYLQRGERTIRIEHFLHQALRYVNTDSHMKPRANVFDSPFAQMFYSNANMHEEESDSSDNGSNDSGVETRTCTNTRTSTSTDAVVVLEGNDDEEESGENLCNEISTGVTESNSVGKSYSKNTTTIQSRKSSSRNCSSTTTSILESSEREKDESNEDGADTKSKIGMRNEGSFTEKNFQSSSVIEEILTPTPSSFVNARRTAGAEEHHKHDCRTSSSNTLAAAPERRKRKSKDGEHHGVDKGPSQITMGGDEKYSHEDGNKYIMTSGPPGIKNSGSQCCGIAIFLGMQSLSLVMGDVSNMFQQIIIEKKRPEITILTDEPENKILDFSRMKESRLVEVYIPLSSAFVVLGKELSTETERRENVYLENENNHIQTRNKYPSLSFDNFDDLSSKLFRREQGEKFETQDVAKQYFDAVITRLRAEIYTQNKCDIYRHFARTVRTGKKCANCTSSGCSSNMCPWSWSVPKESEFPFICIKNPPTGWVADEESMRHGIIDGAMYHLDDLFVMNQSRFGIRFKATNAAGGKNSDTIAKENKCNGDEFYQNEIVVVAPTYLIVSLERESLQKVTVSRHQSSSSSSTSTKKCSEWKYIKDKTPMYVPPIFTISTESEGDVPFTFKSAICFNAKGIVGQFYVLKRVGPNLEYRIKVADGVVSLLTEFQYARELFENSTVLFYEKNRKVCRTSGNVSSGCSERKLEDFRDFPDIPDRIINFLNSTKPDRLTKGSRGKSSKRLNLTRASKKCPSPHNRIKVEVYDFTKYLVAFANCTVSGTPPLFRGSTILSQKLQSKEECIQKVLERKQKSDTQQLRRKKKRSSESECGGAAVVVHPNKKQRLVEDSRQGEKVSSSNIRTHSPTRKWVQNLYDRKNWIVGKNSSSHVNNSTSTATTSVVRDLHLDDSIILQLQELQFAMNDPYNHESTVEIHSSQGTMTCAHDDEKNSCVYCLEETSTKLGNYLFICTECHRTNGMDEFSEKVSSAIVDESKQKVISSMCIHCQGIVDKNINMYHELGTFLFCQSCINEGYCKCTVCKSERYIHVLAKENLQSKKPFEDASTSTSNHLDSFLNRELTLAEKGIFGFLYVEEEDCKLSNQKYIAHSRDTWVSFADLQQLILMDDRTPGESVTGKEKFGMGFEVDTSSYVLQPNVIKHFVTLMMDEMDDNIYFYQAEDGADLKVFEEHLDKFVKNTFYYHPHGIFGTKSVYFHIQTMPENWFVVEMSMTSVGKVILTYLDTNAKDNSISTEQTADPVTIGAIQKVLSKTWEKMHTETPTDQFECKLTFEMINCSSNDLRGDKDIYALFLLRDWVYSTSSKNLEAKYCSKLVEYIAICIIHKTAKYY